ncbi:MAG: dephospho-CoA kinase [Gammaproteobacteria bacterium]
MAATDAAGLTVGLTGGVASGKSTAAGAFHALGVPLLEADQVAREVVAPGTPALARIRSEFGAEFLKDGALDRPKMRAHVFADPDARRRLEQITHPAIRERLAAWRDAQTGAYCVLDVPILVESGMDALVDRVLVIDVPEPVQLARLLERDRIGDALARQMVGAQAPREQRLARADDCIANNGSIAQLRAAIGRLHEFYLDLARSGRKRAPGLRLQ